MNDPYDNPDSCPKQDRYERMIDHADYLRDCAKDDRICPPDPSPEEIAADARDAAEDAKTMAEDARYKARQIEEMWTQHEQERHQA